MELILPKAIRAKLSKALAKGGVQEIGGVLMGEHLGGSRFRVAQVTVQFGGGGVARFVRSMRTLVAPLRSFFNRTKHDYRRFNYLGEWHSHPLFALLPSTTDRETMQSLVEDPAAGANFAVLLRVKLDSEHTLQTAATVFVPRSPTIPAKLEIE